ncbi:hypothetical protein SLEP1_g20450 [Rubroshorea leprosula]|uniref:Protein kinase domain-containing protein n=1 Tax=Rubroshorea leprosula TaxID=152421 RepID=A0AAV5JBS5_9ROSI|nr:hypothetical protein SLEP1_g20450 [Rubroshorea leprosula]
MLILTIFFISLLHLLHPTTATFPYNATDIILLDCGAQSNTISESDGRNWDTDISSRYSSFNDQKSSIPSIASHQGSSVPAVPFLSARIIKSEFTYSFPVSSGPKFLRLYFYPYEYDNFNMTASFFSVTANIYTLLKNFSAHMHLTEHATYLIKEFLVTVRDKEMLNVTFIPSPNSFAFINGIEIVSMPSGLYLNYKPIPLVTVVVGQSFPLDNNTTSLETLHRLNVGGNGIENVNDAGMYRTWSQDGDYLVGSHWTVPILNKSQPIQFTESTPEYTAPKELYTTSRMMGNNTSLNLKSNMTWKFPVDAGFYYLVRLHFCEILMRVTGDDQHVFDIFINNQTAQAGIDVFKLAGGSGHPMYEDYVVMAENNTKGKDLWLALHPQPKKIADAFLNGLEIFKLNLSGGNLAGPNPDPIFSPAPPNLDKRPGSPKSKVTSTILPIIGAILGGFALFALLLSFFVFQRRRKLKDTSKLSTIKSSPLLPSDLCRHFSIAQIKAATQDFNDQFLIGIGGFGNVYKGIIDGETTTVAIKRLKSSSMQGAHEFHTEISMLSKLRHMHLVSLIGYCDDQGEMILVYEYMPRGTLQDHLYRTENPPLSWKRRLEICIGAARGLHYLHKETKNCIIHRDVKSSNILLDENYMAKVSDFGLSKLGPTSASQTHVSTVVKGSIGYLDPEYYRRQHLTEKSDVYSFGVVLFEVLCARPPVIPGLSKEKVSLAPWARLCYLKGTLDEIIDPCLTGQIAPMALQKFGEVAEKCVRDNGMERPTMSDIVWALEFTLQLQETTDKKMTGSDATTTDDEFFSGSTENVAKSQQPMSDTSSCGITVSELSIKTKILEKDTTSLRFGDDN